MMREQVKKIAIRLVKSDGLINLSREKLCDEAGISNGSFQHIMGCSFTNFVEELQGENIKQSCKIINKRRAHPMLRKAHILRVAVNLAKKQGYDKITREKIAADAGVSESLINTYFGTMDQLRVDVMRHAVEFEIPSIIAQGLATNNRHAKKASPELKQKAATLLTSN